jgi:hypothetical protein
MSLLGGHLIRHVSGIRVNALKLRICTKRKYILPEKIQQFRGKLISLSSQQKHKFLLKKADILGKKGGKWVGISYITYKEIGFKI